MNCYNCGEEIKSGEGHVCNDCLDAAGVDPTARDDERKKSGELELSPEEAIRAMLDGETLTASGVRYMWHADKGAFSDIHKDYPICTFYGLCRLPQKKTRPMDTFECLAWVNSPDSIGWMVSKKPSERHEWEPWDIPHRFSYDSCSSSYRRARVLPDKSGIDESTIQGFVVEVE